MSFVNLGTPPIKPVSYPAWGGHLVKVVNQALCKAWGDVVADHPEVLALRDEDKITDKLISKLSNLRRAESVKGFTSAVFAVPMRDAKLPDCHGKSIDQTPDLSIHLVGCRQGVTDDRHDALFFECKVLDRQRGLGLYRTEGINRFVSGKYAWRMPHAGMLAYAFDGHLAVPTSALTKYAKRSNAGQTNEKAMRLMCAPTMETAASPPTIAEVATTQHSRSAPLAVDGTTEVITLRHMWLRSS